MWSMIRPLNVGTEESRPKEQPLIRFHFINRDQV